MPTIKEVVKQSGMSLATVSMVLRGGAHAAKFSEATREKVVNCARELGYRRNFFASQIRPTSRKVLMMFVMLMILSIAPVVYKKIKASKKPLPAQETVEQKEESNEEESDEEESDEEESEDYEDSDDESDGDDDYY